MRRMKLSSIVSHLFGGAGCLGKPSCADPIDSSGREEKDHQLSEDDFSL